MAFSGDLVLHTHMRMSGAWHVYRPGERWQRPSRNVLKSELDGNMLGRILDVSRRLMKINVMEMSGSLDPFQKLWVYGRGGTPCRRCGSRIQSRKTGAEARVTYWCPSCQPA